MRILITGANGQVGSELVQLGLAAGHDVIAVNRFQLDITDKTNVHAIVETIAPDVVINAAAYTAVDKAEDDEENSFQVNAEAVKNLALAAKSHSIPLLHISTDYVFDGTKGAPYLEEDEISPVNKYGEGKLLGECYLQESGVKFVILRTSWVFGLSGNNFVKTMLNLAAERDGFGVVHDQVGGPTFAADIAKTLLNIAELVRIECFDSWGVFHYSGLPYVSWWEFSDYIFDRALEAGFLKNKPVVKQLKTSEFPTRAKRPQDSRLNLSKIERVFNVSPSEWKAGVEEILQNSRQLEK